MTTTRQSTAYENAKLFARHTLGMTEAESAVYAAGFEDHSLNTIQHQLSYGALAYAYRAGWEDAEMVESDPS